MSKAEFFKVVNEGINRGRDWLVVKVLTEGHSTAEIIINGKENFGKKINYYTHAYDDNMMLIKAKADGKEVRIVDALMTNNLSDLTWFCY